MEGAGSVNYWPRWINAIKKRTATLSLMQMGAYDRLLDHYYAEEQPLPADVLECCRIAGAITKPEQDAVRSVLARFFVLDESGHRNERADEEILVALPKIAASKANGKSGGRPKGSRKNPKSEPDKKPAGFPEGTRDETSPSPSPSVVGEAIASPPTGSGATHSPDGEYIADDPLPTGTAYGEIAGAIRKAGISAVDPGYPAFRTLVDAGATADEFVAFVPDALTKHKPFAWLLSAVSGERTRAADMAKQLHRGQMPNKQEALEQRGHAIADAWANEGTS